MFSRKKRNRILKKIFVIFAITAILGLNATPFGTVHAADSPSLTEISLLNKVVMDAQLKKISGTDPYKLDLKLIGENVVNVELLNPSKTAVFYAKELNGKWHANGNAHVKTNLLPLLDEALLPTVTSISDLTGKLLVEVNTLSSTVETIINSNGLTDKVLYIDGLDELTSALGALENLDEAIGGLLVYENDFPVTQGANGEFVVDFTDNLGKRLEPAVNKLVVRLLNDVIVAIEDLEVVLDLSKLPDAVLNGPVVDLLNSATGGILGGLLGDGLIGDVVDNVGTLTSLLKISTDPLLAPIQDVLLPQVRALLTKSTGDILNLLDNLVSLQVIGTTEITVPLTVDNPSGLNQDVKVFGAALTNSNITLELLNNLVDFDTITFNEKAPDGTKPTTPTTTTPTTTTPTTTTTTTGGNKLPNTSTDMWIYGLTGISTLVAGIGTRRFSRRK